MCLTTVVTDNVSGPWPATAKPVTALSSSFGNRPAPAASCGWAEETITNPDPGLLPQVGPTRSRCIALGRCSRG